MSRYDAYAKRALDGGTLTHDEALAVLHAPDDDLHGLLLAAFRVRERYWGRRVKLCMLRNARSGLCPEDCHYCSQSAVSSAAIESYRLQPLESLVEGARAAVGRGARRYCMVTSGRGPSARDIAQVSAATRAIRAEYPELEICVSLGIMGETEASELKAAGVGWVNHNLNTSERFHPEICTTHTYADRVGTVQAAKRAGLAVCCGGIIGMGEGDEDVVDLAFALRALGVDSLPLNFLLAIDGTPLGAAGNVAPTRALRALCLMRFTNPASDIRAAGGRERNLGDWQGLALYPANSVFVEGYLTTPGLATTPTRRLIETMGFEVEHEVEIGDATSPEPQSGRSPAQA